MEERRFKQRMGVRFRKMNGEFYLAYRNNAYKVNEVAYHLWSHCQSGCSLAELVDLIQQTYDVSPEEAKADCTAFVDEALALELLVQA